jgi:(p)ppGpp synthase/HD superfamily hydrolase
MTTAIATPERPRSSDELKAEVATLEQQLSEHARAGANDLYDKTVRELQLSKSQLRAAEHRELAQAADKHRVEQARKQAGMDVDGSLKSAGYPTPGDAIAAHLRGGRVTTSNLEHLVRQAMAKP